MTTNNNTTALSAVETSGQGGLALHTVADIMTVAGIFRASGMFPDVKTEATAAVKIMAGQELGIPPFAAMRGIEIVEGKPEIKPALLAALIRRRGVYDYKVFQRDAQGARIGFYRNGEFLGESIYTMEQAQKAGLAGKSNWVRMPTEMLYWRAMSNGVRVYCPDVTMGAAYVEGELDVDRPMGTPPTAPEPVAPTLAKPTTPQGPNVRKAEPVYADAVVVDTKPAKATAPADPDPAPPVVEPEAPKEPAKAGPVVGKITLQDRRNIQAAAEAAGLTPEDVKAYLLAIGYERSVDVPKAELRRIMADVDTGDAFRIARGLPLEEPPAADDPNGPVTVGGQLVNPATGEVVDPDQAALFA